MVSESQQLEILVAKIQKHLLHHLPSKRMSGCPGAIAGRKRQITSVRDRVGQYDILIVMDCKDYKVPVDVKQVEEFAGLLGDVGAQRGSIGLPTEASRKQPSCGPSPA